MSKPQLFMVKLPISSVEPMPFAAPFAGPAFLRFLQLRQGTRKARVAQIASRPGFCMVKMFTMIEFKDIISGY